MRSWMFLATLACCALARLGQAGYILLPDGKFIEGSPSIRMDGLITIGSRGETRAFALGDVVEACFSDAVEPKVPSLRLSDGSRLVGRTEVAEGVFQVRLGEGSWAKGAATSMAEITFQVPRNPVQATPGVRGAQLMNGDFFEGVLRKIDDVYVTLDSIPLGRRSFRQAQVARVVLADEAPTLSPWLAIGKAGSEVRFLRTKPGRNALAFEGMAYTEAALPIDAIRWIGQGDAVRRRLSPPASADIRLLPRGMAFARPFPPGFVLKAGREASFAAGPFTRFAGYVAAERTVETSSRAVAEIFNGSERLWRSPELVPGAEPIAVDINVPRGATLVLKASSPAKTPPGVIWLDPALLKPGSATTLPARPAATP